MPVAAVIRSQSRTSASKPSQPDEVPFQPMASTLAWASSSAARSNSSVLNWASACSESATSVTLKRVKCAETSGRPASMAAVIGSSEVLDDGVSMPRKTGLVIRTFCFDAFSSREPVSTSLENALAPRIEPVRLRHDLPAACQLHRHQIVGEIARRQLTAHLDEGGGLVGAVEADDEIV